MAYFLSTDGSSTTTIPACEGPSALKKARTSPRKSPQEILKREAMATAAHQAVLKERVDQARAHDAKVASVRATKAAYSANGMEILGAGKPVKLPAHLQANVDAHAAPTAEAILEKEAKAAKARTERLNATVSAAKAHDAKVAAAQALKASFKENGMEIIDNGKTIPLPVHLQARLDGLPKAPTPAELLDKESKAAAARDEIIKARVAGARAHNIQGAEVRERKGEFAETGMEMMGSKCETVKLPPHLQKRLEAAPKHSAEEILARQARAKAAHEALIGAKVANAKAHDAVVQERLGAKKRKAESDAGACQTMEE